MCKRDGGVGEPVLSRPVAWLCCWKLAFGKLPPRKQSQGRSKIGWQPSECAQPNYHARILAISTAMVSRRSRMTAPGVSEPNTALPATSTLNGQRGREREREATVQSSSWHLCRNLDPCEHRSTPSTPDPRTISCAIHACAAHCLCGSQESGTGSLRFSTYGNILWNPGAALQLKRDVYRSYAA
jgi:hypothetical protein